MSTPTYDEIRRLSNQLRKETRIKARREIGTKLHNKLKSESVLRRLVAEATPKTSNWPEEDSIVATRCRAMAGVWTSVIQGAIHVAHSVVSGRVKITEPDIVLPYQLLIASDKSKAFLEGESVSIPMISKKLVRTLLKYCLDFLGNEAVSSVAGVKLVEMLSFLCSKREYVCFFKYGGDFSGALDEISVHLTPETEEDNYPFFNEAAKALESLFSTTRDIGIDMHAFVSDTMGIIAIWCKSYLEGEGKEIRPQAPALACFYNTLSSIILSHPDYSIAPMRRYGRSILRHCKKCYPNAKSSSKYALNSFLLAHIYLSQFVGSIQGRVTGQAGNLGKATLVPALVEQLLQMVMRDVGGMFEKVYEGPSARKKEISWTSLDFRQRQHLELAAKLLAFAQHDFIQHSQLQTLEDPTDALLSSLKTRTPESDEWVDQIVVVTKACPEETLQQSPWTQHILDQLAKEVDWKGTIQQHFGVQSQEFAHDGLSKKINRVSQYLEGISKRPSSSSSSLESILLVISACAEIFPAGNCWTSTVLGKTTELGANDPLIQGSVSYPCCSVFDFSVIILLLASILENEGGPAGDQGLQLRALAALVKLSRPTGLFARHAAERLDFLSLLDVAWQTVWKVLLRPDLRYRDYTKVAAASTVGEVVLVLLREIVRNRCTDLALWRTKAQTERQSSFVFGNQSQIWNLPVFGKAPGLASIAAIQLVGWMVHTCGISEAGNDCIDATPILSIQKVFLKHVITRKWKIICFVFKVLECVMMRDDPNSNELVTSLIATIVALSRGFLPKDHDTDHLANVFGEEFLFQGPTDFKHTTVNILRQKRIVEMELEDSCLSILWGHEESNRNMDELHSKYDATIQSLSLYLNPEVDKQDLQHSTDSSRETKLFEVWKLVTSETIILSPERSCSESQPQTDMNLSLGRRILLLKVTFSFLLLDFNTENNNSLTEIMKHFLTALTAPVADDVLDIAEGMTYSLQLLKGVLAAVSGTTLTLDASILEDILETCSSMLHKYMKKFTVAPTEDSFGRVAQSHRKNADDWMDEDDEVALYNGKSTETPRNRRTSIHLDASSEEDVPITSGKKRKRSLPLAMSTSRKNPRKLSSVLRLADHESAGKVAQMLVLLDPSSASCELACRALLAADLDLDPVDLSGDVDLRGIDLCLKLLTSSSVILHNPAIPQTDEISGDRPRNSSAISILRRVLELIRSNAVVGQELYSSGYEESSTVHTIRAGLMQPLFTSSDSSMLVEILQHDDGLKSSALRRAKRISSALVAFHHGGDSFHECFDKAFSNFVKMHVADSSFFVRQIAFLAVSDAIRALDETKVIQAIGKLTPPISSFSTREDQENELRAWYDKHARGEMQDDDMFTMYTTELMEAEAVNFGAVAAASAPSSQNFLKYLFDLVMIPLRRPDLEFVSFRALEKVAQIRRYETVEVMLSLELPGLLQLWVNSRFEAFPLLLSAPQIVRRLLRWIDARGYLPQELNMDEIRSEASLSLIARERRLLVPLTFFQSLDNLPKPLKPETMDRDHMLEILVASKMHHICAPSVEDRTAPIEGTDLVSRSLHKYTGNIKAFTYLMLHSNSQQKVQKGETALAVLDAVLTSGNVMSRMKKKGQTMIRQILELISVSRSLQDLLPCATAQYTEALNEAVADLTFTTEIGTVHSSSTNSVLNLVRSVASLNASDVPFHKQSIWDSIALQVHVLARRIDDTETKQTERLLFVHILTEMLLNPDILRLTPEVLNAIMQLLETILQDERNLHSDVESRSVFQRLIGACFHVHESSQRTILLHWDRIHNHREQMLRGSRGIAGYSSEIRSAWGLSESSDDRQASDMSSSIGDTPVKIIELSIIRTQSVIKWIFKHISSLRLQAIDLVSFCRPHAISDAESEILLKVNDSFSAQVLTHDFQQNNLDLESIALELRLKLTNRQAWMTAQSSSDIGISSNEGLTSLNLDQRLLYSLLFQCKRVLAEGGIELLSENKSMDIDGLIRSLLEVCGASCPAELRILAGECLGSLPTQALVHLQLGEDRASSTGNVGPLHQNVRSLDETYSKCLQFLADSLKSPDSKISLIASETLESLLTTERGISAFKRIQNKSTRAMLEPLAVSHPRKRETAMLQLHEVDLLKQKVGIDESGDEYDQWCWSEELWLCFYQREVTYKDWICSICTAIIECSFIAKTDESGREIRKRTADDEFFWRCKRICSVEHNVASFLFPYMVVYLIRAGPEVLGYDPNLRLTRAFSMVMERCLSHAMSVTSREVLALLIDSLDTLRRVSQAEFLAQKHGRNIVKLPERDQSQNDSRGHNAGFPGPNSWKGVPYGTILKMDGILVAKTCLLIHRYSSALFYLELHLNATFGKVEALFLESSRSALLPRGYYRPADNIGGTPDASNVSLIGDQAKSSLLHVLSTIKKCYELMGEYDALAAVESHGAAIAFERFGYNPAEFNDGYSDPSEYLRMIQTASDHSLPRHFVHAANSLKSLGFYDLTKSYIEGVLATDSQFNFVKSHEADVLRDDWFESSLRVRQWEILESLSKDRSGTKSLSQGEISTIGDEKFGSRTSNASIQGFFESISSAMEAHVGGDLESCVAHLKGGRIHVIREVGRSGNEESTLHSTISFVDKFQTLQKIEDILTAEDHELLRLISSDAVDHNSTLRTISRSLREDVDWNAAALSSTAWLRDLAMSSVYAKRFHERGPALNEVFASLVSTICKSAVAARRTGMADAAVQSIRKLHHLLNLVDQPGIDSAAQVLLLRLQEARILESRGDFKGAIRTSQQVVEHLQLREVSSGNLTMRSEHLIADSQLACGGWLTKYKVQQASTVLKHYLQPGSKRARRIYDEDKTAENADRTVRASLALGQTVANLHEALVARLRSPEFKKSSNTDHQESELKRCEPLLAQTRLAKSKARKGSKHYEELTKSWEELFIYCENLKKDIIRTASERESVMKTEREYLQLAIESYTTSLSLVGTSSENGIMRHVFDFVSLWFNSQGDDTNSQEATNRLMEIAFSKIPTFRFVPLANQLFSRIEETKQENEGSFQTVLQNLVVRMCEDHPYHCIVPLLTLANGKKVGSGVSGRNVDTYIQNVGNSKVAPANDIMKRLRRQADPYVIGLLDSYSLLADSYIDLAGAETASFHKKLTKDISFSKLNSSRIKTLDKCLGSGRSMVQFPPAVITSPPALRPGADYGDGIEDPIGGERVRGFKSVFSITETGLHRPKIVVCLGTKGGEFRQLVKGEDEIRQDAIMCQVFSFVNTLMSRQDVPSERHGAKRVFRPRLRIVTYNVIPMSPASGVLEWVEDTSSFGDVICGRGSRSKDYGLHARYYPKEWSFLLCRKHLAESPHKQKRETYDEICRRFSPCFRFFFMEEFGDDMMNWHASRMRYIRSVAVSSMVGHILGIGDRHTSNILVQKKTAEVVQIDFGIVFEQGKLLNVPELVPFRLTRNMVDGMGPCGTDGTFVRSAEQTITVLRNNAKSLLTILSAVVADPLYKWSVSPVEGRRRQNRQTEDENISAGLDANRKTGRDESVAGIPEDKNEMGKKALAKINDKLQGYEEATSGEQQGVEGQVQLLINSAQDVDNLCRMYPGWSPFI